MKKMRTVLAVAGLFLAMALSTTSAMADTIWTGGGDGVNWSDTLNWSADPTTAGGTFTLPTGTESTVDTDTTAWTDYTVVWADDTVTLNVIAGGVLENNGMHQPNGGTLRQTGGEVNFGNRVQGVGGLTEISGGSYHNARWTYVSSGTLHIIGSQPTSVSIGTFPSWSPSAQLTARFTLDANGVTPMLLGREGDFHGHAPTSGFITVDVDGIATYLAGSGNVGDILPLVTRSGGLKYPAAWTMGLVDCGLGSVGLDVDGNLQLTILGVPELAITEIQYAPDADTVTLTWTSRPCTTYKAFVTLDLIDWSHELANSLGPDTGGIIVDGNLLTMSFTLTDGLEDEPDVFFRIQEE